MMSNSPWSAWAVIQQVQVEIAATPGLERSGVLILDESTDVKAGKKSAGSGQQYNGRFGKGEDESGGDSSGLCQLVGVDGELYLSEDWFTPEMVELREKFFDNIPKKQYFFHPHPQSFTPPI